jgi:hemin uptake protein HemP
MKNNYLKYEPFALYFLLFLFRDPARRIVTDSAHRISFASAKSLTTALSEARDAEPLMIDANTIFSEGRREVEVQYKNKRYRLRVTAQDKLLLTM